MTVTTRRQMVSHESTTRQPDGVSRGHGPAELARLRRWVRSPTTSQRVVTRSLIVLLGAAGHNATSIAAELGIDLDTVGKWAQERGLAYTTYESLAQLEPVRESPLLARIAPGDYAYFVHSYALPVGPHTVATATYGAPFTAIVSRGNFHGAQFHPERSARTGTQLLENFLSLAA